MGLRSWAAGHPVVLDPEVRWMHEWQRATTRIRLAPWMHELRAGRQFYGTYPELLSRRVLNEKHAKWKDMLWTPARDVTTVAP